jgi:5'-3' exonuclease
MILVDLNQVLISNLMAQTRGKSDIKPNKEMVRYMVINSLRGLNLKFKNAWGEMVLCADAANPWRRDIYPNYKHARRQGRVDSATDWDNIFMVINEIREEIKENFPFKVMHIEKAEADDLIATLVNHKKDDMFLIISGDKDFIQLQIHPYVKQYSPILKKYIGEDLNPITFLHEQIIKGDRSDGIPNILSPDDIFLTKEKQRPINKKRLEEWSKIENIPLGSETKKFYDRNKQLIDLNCIPEDIQKSIINTYNNYIVPNRSKLLPYFIKNKLKSLMENIGDF